MILIVKPQGLAVLLGEIWHGFEYFVSPCVLDRWSSLSISKSKQSVFYWKTKLCFKIEFLTGKENMLLHNENSIYKVYSTIFGTHLLRL